MLLRRQNPGINIVFVGAGGTSTIVFWQPMPQLLRGGFGTVADSLGGSSIMRQICIHHHVLCNHHRGQYSTGVRKKVNDLRQHLFG
jgi:hypothetical protein